jgi:hypothetical protein
MTGEIRENSLPPRKSRLLGVLALVAAVAAAVILSVGMTSANAGQYAAGSGLAYLATGVSVVAVICGASAALLGRGRPWGVVAVVIGLLANPLLLTKLLGAASGLG